MFEEKEEKPGGEEEREEPIEEEPCEEVSMVDEFPP